MTNDHIGREMLIQSLAHQFSGSDDVIRCTNPMVGREYPFDTAISRIDEGIWEICNHTAQPVPSHCFASKHSPVEGELLFLAGHSGDRAKFSFGTLVTRATPYVTQQAEMPAEYGNPTFHFAVPYKPDLAVATSEPASGLPRPPGLSGSLVWNTRYVEFNEADRNWTPADAQVTGIVWGWPSSAACLLATRVEFFSLKELVDNYPRSVGAS